MYNYALDQIRTIFGEGFTVYTLKPSDDDVNTVVFAKRVQKKGAAPGPAPRHAGPGKKKSSASSANTGLASGVRNFLRSVPNQLEDPLGLLALVDQLKLA